MNQMQQVQLLQQLKQMKRMEELQKKLEEEQDGQWEKFELLTKAECKYTIFFNSFGFKKELEGLFLLWSYACRVTFAVK